MATAIATTTPALRSVPRIAEALRWHLAGDEHETAAALSDVDREHIPAIGAGLVAILTALQDRTVTR